MTKAVRTDPLLGTASPVRGGGGAPAPTSWQEGHEGRHEGGEGRKREGSGRRERPLSGRARGATWAPIRSNGSNGSNGGNGDNGALHSSGSLHGSARGRSPLVVGGGTSTNTTNTRPHSSRPSTEEKEETAAHRDSHSAAHTVYSSTPHSTPQSGPSAGHQQTAKATASDRRLEPRPPYHPKPLSVDDEIWHLFAFYCLQVRPWCIWGLCYGGYEGTTTVHTTRTSLAILL